MIRVHRGPEPDELRLARERLLADACMVFDAHGIGKELAAALKDYDVAKNVLYQRQFRKCAYCERRPGPKNQPVEHFRPKMQAWRHVPGEPARIEPGYWWLTWTWENQFFACGTCNGKGTKGNFFPLQPGSGTLPMPPRRCQGIIPAASFDLSTESPVLLDPSAVEIDLLHHLQWHPVNRMLHPSLWTWKLVTPTDQGYWTAKVLDLHELTDDVGDRYRETVWKNFNAEVLSRRGDVVAARSAWSELGALLTARSAVFAAATWWQMEALRTHEIARALGLPLLPRPI